MRRFKGEAQRKKVGRSVIGTRPGGGRNVGGETIYENRSLKECQGFEEEQEAKGLTIGKVRKSENKSTFLQREAGGGGPAQ